MTRRFFRILTVTIFIFSALGIGALVFFPAPRNAKKSREEPQTRIIIPESLIPGTEENLSQAELMARRENYTPRVPLAEGEVVITVLNGLFDGGPVETQFVAYRNLLEIESPVYITFIDYDEVSGSYKRAWSAQTAATRPGTISLFTEDLVGDRSVCVLLSGMNGLGEHTLTVFRKNPDSAPGDELFGKIAELRIDGTITIKEAARSQAYQMGVSRGESFTISAYGKDFESANILDQIEIVYAYNTGNGLYEQRSVTRIPGAQVEQRRVRELLGNSPAFEEFITGLWYYTTPQGTVDKRQYIYFNPPNREIIFYGDETQQVFTWQNSAATRYGLYISSQNISITTLRRSIDIELESLESVKVRVFEDVRLKIGVNAPWDGSYRKAGPMEHEAPKTAAPEDAYIDAYYDGPMGKIHFSRNGSYELNSGGTIRQGKYAFFHVDNREFLELRFTESPPPESRAPGGSEVLRETYLVEGENRGAFTLMPVRIGARGIEQLNEDVISLTLSPE